MAPCPVDDLELTGIPDAVAGAARARVRRDPPVGFLLWAVLFYFVFHFLQSHILHFGSRVAPVGIFAFAGLVLGGEGRFAPSYDGYLHCRPITARRIEALASGRPFCFFLALLIVMCHPFSLVLCVLAWRRANEAVDVKGSISLIW